MANSAQISMALKLLDASSKTILEDPFGISQQAITVAGLDYVGVRTQALGNGGGVGVEEALNLGDIGTIGWLIGKHTGLDASGAAVTDKIYIRAGTGGDDLVEMKPGEPCMFRVKSGVAPYAIASSTGSPVFQYIILED